MYQRRSNRVRAEIAANHDLASKFPEDSPERVALETYGRLLIEDYVRKGIAKATSPRHWSWSSLIATFIAAAGFGYGALLVQAQWAQAVLWTFAGLMVISMFGQVSGPKTRKPKKDSQVTSSDLHD